MSPKPLLWMGTAREDLRAFPASARRRAGHELDLIQQGLEVPDIKRYREVLAQRRGR